MKALLSADDLWHEFQIVKCLLPLKEAIPQLRVTAYAIPNRLGPVNGLAERYPWITFAIHGREHAPFECRTWTDEYAKECISHALSMGYAPIFKAPNYAMDADTESACSQLGVILHTDNSYDPCRLGTRIYNGSRATDHFYVAGHLQNYSGCKDYIPFAGSWKVETLRKFDTFLTPLDVARTQ